LDEMLAKMLARFAPTLTQTEQHAILTCFYTANNVNVGQHLLIF